MGETNIKTADEYNRVMQENLKLDITDEEYKQLKDDLGITEKEKRLRKKAEEESRQKEIATNPIPIKENPLIYNLDMPFTT